MFDLLRPRTRELLYPVCARCAADVLLPAGLRFGGVARRAADVEKSDVRADDVAAAGFPCPERRVVATGRVRQRQHGFVDIVSGARLELSYARRFYSAIEAFHPPIVRISVTEASQQQTWCFYATPYK